MAPKPSTSQGTLRQSHRLRRRKLKLENDEPIFIDLEVVTEQGGEQKRKVITSLSYPEQKKPKPTAKGVLFKEPPTQSSMKPFIPGKGKEVEQNDEPVPTEELYEFLGRMTKKYGFESRRGFSTSSYVPLSLPSQDPPLDTPPSFSSKASDLGSLDLLSKMDEIIAIF